MCATRLLRTSAANVGAGSTRTERSRDARLSLGDEAVAAVVFESCAKSRSVGPGQVDDTQSIDSLAIDNGLMYADLRSVERGRIFGVESPAIGLGVGFRFWRCHLYGPASRRRGGLIEALLGGRSLRPKQVAEGMQHTVKGLLRALGGRHRSDDRLSGSLRGIRPACRLLRLSGRPRRNRLAPRLRLCARDRLGFGEDNRGRRFARTFRQQDEPWNRRLSSPDRVIRSL